MNTKDPANAAPVDGFVMRAFTDYPIVELGDQPHCEAPMRSVDVTSYDGDKYCRVRVEGIETEIKHAYLYAEAGRCGETTVISVDDLPVT